MELRDYRPEDLEEILRLFYNSVHTVAAEDYTSEQLDVWAPKEPDIHRWRTSVRSHLAVVAVEDGAIVGFGDIDADTGYLDRLYVRKDFQRRGIATAICDRLESEIAAKNIGTDASITAKPFFEKRGYRVVEERQVVRGGVILTNFSMRKV